MVTPAYPSFRPSEARAGIHKHDRFVWHRSCDIARAVAMDSGLAASRRPGMTARYNPNIAFAMMFF